MEFQVVGKDINSLQGEALVVGVYQEQVLSPLAARIDEKMSSLLKDFLKDIHFKAEVGKCVFMPGHKDVKFKNIIIVGLGKKEKLSLDTVRQAAAAGLKEAKKLRHKEVYFELLGEEALGDETAKALAEGIELADYQFDKYKKKEEDEVKIEKIKVLGEETVNSWLSLDKNWQQRLTLPGILSMSQAM